MQEWLVTAPESIFEMRDMAVLQLFFSEFASEETIVALARQQVRLYEERLAIYRSIADQYHAPPLTKRRMAPLELGIRMAEACIEFWSEIADRPPGS